MSRSAGPFEILEILGEGSFGTVCVARITKDPLQRKVALKILKGTYAKNQKVLNRTRDEARLLSRMNHPNIVRVEQLIEISGRPVVVMELVRGVSLDQLLLRFKDGLPASIAIEVIRQSSLALHVAYNEAQGDDGRPMRVIHRDIKPSNIMLSTTGEVKVMDFGIARGEFDGREAETESVVMGSRPYMAPERLDGVSDNPSVDVYSAGMTLFELLTGRTMSLSINPTAHEQAMTRQLGYLQVRSMSTPGAVDDLRSIVRSMCNYERDYRPSAIEVARDLERCMQHITIEERLSLKEFSSKVVVPIYESRPKITIDQAMQQSEDGEFLREVTNHLTGSTPVPPESQRPMLPLSTVGFAAAMGFLVFTLALLAALKAGQEWLAPDDHGYMPDDKVKVKVWFPADAAAVEVGDSILTVPGSAWVQPGDQLLKISFDDGNLLHCPYQADVDTELRVMEQLGHRGFTVNDGDFRACTAPEPGSSDNSPIP